MTADDSKSSKEGRPALHSIVAFASLCELDSPFVSSIGATIICKILGRRSLRFVNLIGCVNSLCELALYKEKRAERESRIPRSLAARFAAAKTGES